MDPSFVMVIGFALIIVLMLLLNILQRRALSDLLSRLEHQSRQIDALATRPAPSGNTGRIAAQVGTAALERKREPGPAIVERRTPTSIPAIAERHTPAPGPAIVERHTPTSVPAIVERHTPTSSPKLEEASKRPATTRHSHGEWNPTHRITFKPESGKPQTWLVSIAAAPYGHRIAVTHAEWAAGVTPAWHCNPDGSWTCHGMRTPDGVRGTVLIDEFTGSHPI